MTAWSARALPALALALAPVAASATPSFDPTAPVQTWNDTTALVNDAEGLPLWDRIELHRDADVTLFPTEVTAPGHRFSDSAPLSPHLVSLFGSPEPASTDFLLHYAPGWAFAERETPVLLVPGAGTSASGVFGPLARSLASRGRAVFAISFPHFHGDCFQQAEHVADAVARVRELTGAETVDIVGHSKGGIAAAVYLGHRGVTWGGSARADRYTERGTAYRGDVRRFVAIAVPFGGVDTPFRWTATHVLTGMGNAPLSPSAWTDYYPYTTTAPAFVDDLSAVDLWPAGGDSFPGQAQLLARWDDVHTLPGARPSLGVFALQQDWLTTYEGGLGFYSYSPGLDDAIEAGGGFVDQLLAAPFAPAVELSVLVGVNPLIPVARDTIENDTLGENWGDWVGQSPSAYAALVDGAMADDFPDLEPTDAEYDALAAGDMALGEITGLSDGLVFDGSATATAGFLADGATLVETHRVDLSHLDLLFASPPLGQALIDGAVAPEDAWEAALGARWIEADTHGWVAAQLERGEDGPGDDDDSAGDDDDSTSDDDDSTSDDDDSAADDDDSAEPDLETPWTGCDCSIASPAGPGPAWLLGLLALALRRRRTVGPRAGDTWGVRAR